MGLQKYSYDKKSQNVGDSAEKRFCKACIQYGMKAPVEALESENKYKHWDFKMSNGKTVDVKASKKKE